MKQIIYKLEENPEVFLSGCMISILLTLKIQWGRVQGEEPWGHRSVSLG